MVNQQYIDFLMKTKGIKNYTQLAEKCNLHYTTFLYIFKGHNPGIGTLLNIANYFQVTVDRLLITPDQIQLYLVSQERTRKIGLKNREHIPYIMFCLLIHEE